MLTNQMSNVHRFTELASECHNYTQAVTKSFTCPGTFAEDVLNATENFLAGKNQLLCGRAGIPMQSIDLMT
jgi:hypothetical protein